MKTKSILYTLVSGIITMASCTKEGLGGKAIVVAHIAHHDTPIKGATLYVKFNAKELPGTDPSDYDLTIGGESNEDHIHVEGLKKGDYYFYAIGYDSTIAQVVKGGMYVKIKHSERKAEKEVHLPVTED